MGVGQLTKLNLVSLINSHPRLSGPLAIVFVHVVHLVNGGSLNIKYCKSINS